MHLYFLGGGCLNALCQLIWPTLTSWPCPTTTHSQEQTRTQSQPFLDSRSNFYDVMGDMRCLRMGGWGKGVLWLAGCRLQVQLRNAFGSMLGSCRWGGEMPTWRPAFQDAWGCKHRRAYQRATRERSPLEKAHLAITSTHGAAGGGEASKNHFRVAGKNHF